jgi:hypothetical protein
MYNENDIKAQLKNQSASVDTDQLWNDLKHHAPIKKRKNWLPLLLMFGLGGLMSAAMFYSFFQSPCLPNENKWQVIVDSIMTNNKILQEKLYANIIEIETLKGEIKQANEVIQESKAHKHFNINNHNISKIVQPKSEYIAAINHYSNTNSSLSENNIAQTQEIAQSPLQQAKVEQISTITSAQIVAEKEQKEIDQPMLTPKIIPNQTHNSWQYFMGITSGAALVIDRQLDKEGNNLTTSFAPFLSYSADFGLFKKVKGRFSLGALVNYNNIVYRLNYHNTMIENISFIDTSEISISSVGSENVVIGNVGGKQITEQKGKIHGYQHRFSIIPSIQYQSITRGKWALSHQMGLGVDVFILSKNIIPTHDERSFLSQQVKGMALKPYLRVGTNLEYSISKNLGAAFIMQCTYRNENYNFSSYSGKRSAIFPSLGLGLYFY